MTNTTTTSIYSRRIGNLMAMAAPVSDFIENSRWARRAGEPGISNFMLGNPHEQPLPAFTQALQKWSVPQNRDWYAYKQNEPSARAVVAQSLRRRRGMPFEAEDVFLTTGAFSAISVVLTAITDPGDEVIFVSPPWFFYESLIVAAGGTPVRVKCNPATFDLDLDAIETAISSHTRAS
jgi:aspartate aminotransferase